MSSIIDSSRSEIDLSDEEYIIEQTDILADVLGKPIKTEIYTPGPQIGKIVDIDKEGRVLVEYSAYLHGPVLAQLTSSVRDQIIQQKIRAEQKVLLVFENGRSECPIIVDTLHTTSAEPTDIQSLDVALEGPQEVNVDGKRISFNALEEVVLRCGKASITLTSEGRVIIRGAHVVSRSTGTNKIKGGSVQIN